MFSPGKWTWPQQDQDSVASTPGAPVAMSASAAFGSGTRGSPPLCPPLGVGGMVEKGAAGLAGRGDKAGCPRLATGHRLPTKPLAITGPQGWGTWRLSQAPQGARSTQLLLRGAKCTPWQHSQRPRATSKGIPVCQPRGASATPHREGPWASSRLQGQEEAPSPTGQVCKASLGMLGTEPHWASLHGQPGDAGAGSRSPRVDGSQAPGCIQAPP